MGRGRGVEVPRGRRGRAVGAGRGRGGRDAGVRQHPLRARRPGAARRRRDRAGDDRPAEGADAELEQRQIGVVDAAGGSATFTGTGCFDWAGGRAGDGYAAQGNLLAGPAVVAALADTFESTEGPLVERMLARFRRATRPAVTAAAASLQP